MHKSIGNTQPPAGRGTTMTEAASVSHIPPHFGTTPETDATIFASGLWSGNWTGDEPTTLTADWSGKWTGDWTGEAAAEELTSSFALRAVSTAAPKM